MAFTSPPFMARLRSRMPSTTLAFGVTNAALHMFKARKHFGRKEKAKFDRAMIDLQMGMFITMTVRKKKKTKTASSIAGTAPYLPQSRASGQNAG